VKDKLRALLVRDDVRAELLAARCRTGDVGARVDALTDAEARETRQSHQRDARRWRGHPACCWSYSSSCS